MVFRLARAVRRAIGGPRERTGEEASGGLSRRVVLGAIVGTVWASAVRRLRGSTSPLLRPPGAVDEARFTGLCVRCGNCLRVCPTNIIRPAEAEHGIAGLLTPRLDFSDDYCKEDCVRCTQVCPSGALVPIAQQQKEHVSIGLPRVNMDLCLLGDDRECSICRNWCPYEAITLKFCEIEYTLTPRIDATKCPGCGACETACPTAPAKAILIDPR